VSRFVYGTRANVPDYMIKGGTAYRLVADHLGSVRLVVDTTDGTVAQRIDYDEFGRVIQNSSPGFQPFGFAGGLLDDQTNLVRFGARDYDPATGRWTAKDQAGFEGGDGSFYAYVDNDPSNLIDPSGLDWLDAAANFAAGFGDNITFGLTNWVRDRIDANGAVDPTSSSYSAGEWTGVAAGLILGGAGTKSAAEGANIVWKGGEIVFPKGSLIERIAPFGNRLREGDSWFKRLPHYHRRVLDRLGKTIEGQGIGRHRPWELFPSDKSFWSRFSFLPFFPCLF